MVFRNRRQAGMVLADRLRKYADEPGVVVLGLPRGGVPVAFEVAKALQAPLDIFLVRKLGMPGHEELAVGAIGSGGVTVINDEAVQLLRVPRDVIEAVRQREQVELERREAAYRRGHPFPSLADRTVILIDDGLATGSTMRAAVTALRRQRPRRLVVAVPVGAWQTCDELGDEVDEVVCAAAPQRLGAVGEWYEDFDPTTDGEVRVLLEESARWSESHEVHEVQIGVEGGVIEGTLLVSGGARGIVLFAHGSGSGRHSPRNLMVARYLAQRGLGYLLIDLLTQEEAQRDQRSGQFRFDIELLAGRLLKSTDWLAGHPATEHLSVGYFGASTGAAAALVAAATRPTIGAVVSRGGRPDLAGGALTKVEAATLLIVGSRDEAVLQMNEAAYARLGRAAARRIEIVSGASHLFEEAGTLEEAARLAGDWFEQYLPAAVWAEAR